MSSWRLRRAGHDDFQHAEAEVEVAAESALGHVAFQVAVGGGDHPHVDLDRFAAADALEGMPFQHAEELGLESGTHLADFIEHQRALVGGLELADLALRGAGEGAPLVAEQFAGQQIGRQRGAVQAHEDVLVPRTIVVDAAGDQFLAHAALAADQHGGIGGGGAADLVGHLPNHRAAADDLAADAQPLAQLDVFRAHAGEVLGQLLPAADVFHGHRHGVGHGQRELEIVGVGHDRAVGRIEMDQSEHLAAVADRAQMTLVARISPWLSRVPKRAVVDTFRASTASPSRITVEARKFDTR